MSDSPDYIWSKLIMTQTDKLSNGQDQNISVYSFCFLAKSSATVANYAFSTMRFLVRVAKLKDTQGMSAVLANSFHSREGFFGWAFPLLQSGIYEDLQHRLLKKRDHYACLVAVLLPPETALPTGVNDSNEILVGTVEMSVRSLHPWQLDNYEYVYISNLAVDPQYRQKGIARQLLKCCERTASEWGFNELFLHVLENNQAACQLYQQIGYQVHSHDWTWGSLVFGQPRKLFLRKLINKS